MNPARPPSAGRSALFFVQSLLVGGWYFVIMCVVTVGLSLVLMYMPVGGGPLRTFLLALVVVTLTALTLALPHWRQKWTEAYEANTAQELVVYLDHYYEPALRRLRRYVADPTPEGLTKVETAVLATVSNLAGPSDLQPQIRSVLFHNSEGALRQKPDMTSGGKESGRCFDESGRGKASRAAWDTARSGDPLTYHDVTTNPPPGFKRRDSAYETFMTCGILGANGEVLGMLNVDAPRPNVFNALDEKMLKIACQTLAVAYCSNKEVEE